jgi:hypothetical protein
MNSYYKTIQYVSAFAFGCGLSAVYHESSYKYEEKSRHFKTLRLVERAFHSITTSKDVELRTLSTQTRVSNNCLLKPTYGPYYHNVETLRMIQDAYDYTRRLEYVAQSMEGGCGPRMPTTFWDQKYKDAVCERTLCYAELLAKTEEYQEEMRIEIAKTSKVAQLYDFIFGHPLCYTRYNGDEEFYTNIKKTFVCNSKLP